MAPLLSDSLDAYVDAHATPLEPLLVELHEATYASLSYPQMIAGPVLGRLLRFLVAMLAPRLVVEIGTFSGYSALAMAGGLPDGGRIVTCELSPERAAFAQGYFDRSPYGERIELRVGPALDTVGALDGPFDFVFIDADKESYDQYLDWAAANLRRGGVVAGDNAFLFGHLHTGESPPSDGQRAMRAFHQRLATSGEFRATALPTGEGLALGIKL
jgi:caffeoyl-CoA O-methyltransferase